MRKPTGTDRPGQAWLLIDDLYWFLCSRRFEPFVSAIARSNPARLERSGERRAMRAYARAAEAVPAYREFLLANADDVIPETDKKAYIEPYSMPSRCVGGRFPALHTMIDESSGSTGIPFNWIRGEQERAESHKVVSFFVRYCFGDEPTIVINAFSMGAWATGINMGAALQKNAIVKNTGPDVAKILSTLRYIGPGYRYLVLGYPPFLKRLIDDAEAEGFELSLYRLVGLVGGEGMSEGLRDYLLKAFSKVYSGYGATDLELGIAGETPISVAIRRLARDNPAVRKQLFGDDPRLPMVFQYNPLMHHLEVNENREVIFTINRSSLVSPRIRYNVHDEGGIARFDVMRQELEKAGIDFSALTPGHSPIPLPFLWVFGRRDSTLSVMGANLYPEDLEECVYADAELARSVNSFCQELREEAEGSLRPCFHFELLDEPCQGFANRLAEVTLQTLIKLNADFREAYCEHPEALRPEIRLHRMGEGPFAANSDRIKHVRRVASA